MISSSKASVTPEPELARLTLLSSDKAEFIRRQSMLSPTRPSLGEIHGEPILGPLGPPIPETIEDAEMGEMEPPKEAEPKIINGDRDNQGYGSSEDTLIDDLPPFDSPAISTEESEATIQQSIFENKENLPPIKTSSSQSSLEVELTPLSETSPSRMNEQAGPPSPSKDDPKDAMGLSQNTQGMPDLDRETAPNGIHPVTAPPRRSPPLPPRPKQVDSKASNALQEAEVGAQQDVTEVIANFLFQLQCAIKADSYDESGEQVDKVKDLFFGKQKSYTTDKQGKTRTKEEYMSDIKVDVATGPRDIYDALDGAYDVQDVEVGGGVEPQYTSISVLPPVLQVHVQRSLYDREKKAAFKSTNHLELKDRIFMDRYMDSADPNLLERRRQCWQWKKDLAHLKKRRDELAYIEVGIFCEYKTTS